ncbi:MAG TPA: hypothetical protein VHP33_15225, partial [Polyangiaceae bacterium]|nr:hypothetical protein [Polyangiaceae bacterium]
ALLLIALEYAAQSACPARAELWSKISQAAPDVRLVDAQGASRRYRVTVSPAGDGFRGELRDASWPAPRTLEARDCGELVDALALMLALSTAPGAEGAPATGSPEIEVPAAPTSGAPKAATTSPEPPAALPAVRPAATRSIAAERRERQRPVHEAPSSWALVGALVWYEATPKPLQGVVIAVAHDVAPSLVGRLEARVAFASAPDSTFLGLAPQLCGQAKLSELTLAACFGIVAGYLPVGGVESSGGQSSGWLAPLLAGRVGYVLADLVRLEVSAEAEHGFLSRAYHVKVTNEDFRTPEFSALLSAAAGVRF